MKSSVCIVFRLCFINQGGLYLAVPVTTTVAREFKAISFPCPSQLTISVLHTYHPTILRCSFVASIRGSRTVSIASDRLLQFQRVLFDLHMDVMDYQPVHPLPHIARYSISYSRRGYNEASPVWRYIRGAYAINILHRVYFINHGFLAPS